MSATTTHVELNGMDTLKAKAAETTRKAQAQLRRTSAKLKESVAAQPSFEERMHTLAAEMEATLPSPARLITSFVVGTLAYLGTFYYSCVAMWYLGAAAGLLSTSGFLLFCIAFVAYVIAAAAAIYVGKKVFDFACEFDVSSIAERASSIKARISGWFGAKENNHA